MNINEIDTNYEVEKYGAMLISTVFYASLAQCESSLVNIITHINQVFNKSK
jgi:hypothetical protein